MQQIKLILEKINYLANTESAFSLIEKDLMLRYTRDLYETIIASATQQSSPILTEEPETFTPQPTENLIEGLNSVGKIELPINEPKRNEETEKMKEKNILEIEKPFDNSQSKVYQSGSTNYDEETIAEKMPFDLEPELQNDTSNFSNKGASEFMLWNKDVRSYIGINDRYNFISELFHNNSEAYEEILTEISLCNTKNEALQFLDKSGITTLYKWKEDGFSEQIFYNILSQFFASR